MGRPRGSKNRPKEKVIRTDSSVIHVKMEKQIETLPKTTDSMRGWVQWGQRNDFPFQLSSLYYASPTHRSCCDFCASAVLGGGIDYDAMETRGQEETVPNYTQSWEDFILDLATDYAIFGSFAFQITKNKDDKTYSVYHQPISDVRCAPYDEDGCITSYFISSDWTNLSKYPPVELKAFNFEDDEELKNGEVRLFVYRKYMPDSMYYTMPRYSSAIKSIQAEVEHMKYDLKSILNSFNASGILTLQQIDEEEERKRVLDSIEAMFQGSENSSSLMVTFRNNAEQENPVTFTKFDKDVSSVDLFDGNNERTINRIVAAHRIPSKALIGYPSETASLGGDGNILHTSFNLYMRLVGERDQKAIIGTINSIFRLNGVDIELKMKPWDFSILNSTRSDSTETADVEKGVYDADNVEEKVVSQQN